MRFASPEDAQAYYDQYGNFDGPNAPRNQPTAQTGGTLDYGQEGYGGTAVGAGGGIGSLSPYTGGMLASTDPVTGQTTIGAGNVGPGGYGISASQPLPRGGGGVPEDLRYLMSNDVFPTGGPVRNDRFMNRFGAEPRPMFDQPTAQTGGGLDYSQPGYGQSGFMQGSSMMDALYGRGRTGNPFGLGTGGSPFTQPYFGSGGGAGKGGGNPYAPRGGALFGQNFGQPSYGGGKGGGMTPAGFGPRFNNMGGGGGKYGGGRSNMGRDYIGFGAGGNPSPVADTMMQLPPNMQAEMNAQMPTGGMYGGINPGGMYG